MRICLLPTACRATNRRVCMKPARVLFYNDTPTTEIYTVALHDALPILLDERGQPRAALEHERVDDDSLARAALHFLQRLLDRARHGGIAEVGDLALEVAGVLEP